MVQRHKHQRKTTKETGGEWGDNAEADVWSHEESVRIGKSGTSDKEDHREMADKKNA